MMVWLEDAPKLDIDPEKSIEWIDGLISCDIDVKGVIHQQHKHTKSCQRKSKAGVVCRFNIPYPPMRDTCILTPFAKDYPSFKKKRGKEIMSTIKEYLEVHKKELPNWSFFFYTQFFYAAISKAPLLMLSSQVWLKSGAATWMCNPL